MPRVVIVGAGLGGLSAALSLDHWGIEPPIIVEQAEKLEAVGAGIQLGPNANRVLERLGVLDQIRAVAFQPETLDVRDGRRGRMLLSAPLRTWVAAKFGQPYLNVHCGDLQTILANVVEERLPGSIRVGSRVDGVGQQENTTSASLVNGRTISRRRAHRRGRRAFAGPPNRGWRPSSGPVHRSRRLSDAGTPCGHQCSVDAQTVGVDVARGARPHRVLLGSRR